MRAIGIALIVLGALALIYTGFTFTTPKKVLDVGPVEITKDEKHSVNWPPIAGIVLILAGGAVMIFDRRQAS